MHTGDGKVTGPGGPTDDKVNARPSDGEFVIRASSVDKYGTASAQSTVVYTTRMALQRITNWC